MMTQHKSLVLVGLLLLLVSRIDGFLVPQGLQQLRHQKQHHHVRSSGPASATLILRYTVSKGGDTEEMKRDIERMKREAMERLEALNEKMHQAEDEHQARKQREFKEKEEEQKRNNLLLKKSMDESAVKEAAALKEVTTSGRKTIPISQKEQTSGRKTIQISKKEHEEDKIPVVQDEVEDEVDEELMRMRMEDLEKRKRLRDDDEPRQRLRPQDEETRRLIQSTLQEEAFLSSNKHSVMNLLDNTRWRLNLNVGREQGTWMPKTWGISGDRLLMNLEMEFTPEQLTDRDDFLNGNDQYSKVLHVVHNELSTTPNLNEGSIRIAVKDGGWRVARGAGPMGTDKLLFYFDIEEEARHQGSDVYCPKGRIYCQCGYFSMMEAPSRSADSSTYIYHSSGLRDSIRKEQEAMNAQYERLASEMTSDQSFISIEKMQRAKQMMDLRIQAEKLKKKMQEAKMLEPDRASLRMSRKQDVGLTRPGGICIKVNKGVALEYHILGKFEVASIENREHSDYKDLLP